MASDVSNAPASTGALAKQSVPVMQCPREQHGPVQPVKAGQLHMPCGIAPDPRGVRDTSCWYCAAEARLIVVPAQKHRLVHQSPNKMGSTLGSIPTDPTQSESTEHEVSYCDAEIMHAAAATEPSGLAPSAVDASGVTCGADASARALPSAASNAL